MLVVGVVGALGSFFRVPVLDLIDWDWNSASVVAVFAELAEIQLKPLSYLSCWSPGIGSGTEHLNYVAQFFVEVPAVGSSMCLG